MNLIKPGLSVEEVRQIDLVNYLSELGFIPTKISGCNHWYLSPLREEKISSFKVNRKLNRWFDFGLAKGGNIIDFGILYFKCSVSDFLRQINPAFSPHQPLIKSTQKDTVESSEDKIKILREKPLFSYPLYRYLQQRRIPFEVAKKHCLEVGYELKSKEYFGIGFKNDSGGYELRNSYVKCSSSPKDITTIKNGGNEVLVFEGFFDFLSFISIHKNKCPADQDFVILNSVSFFEKARPFMENHQAIKLYLDRDVTGQNCSHYALNLSDKYHDESNLYKDYKDVNDWLMKNDKIITKDIQLKAR